MSASSVSLNTDVNVRYERLAMEYSKLRGQAKVLREGVLEERRNNEKITEKLRSSETVIRKQQSEIESLLFRNEQLTKRVETLQEEAESSRMLGQRTSKKVKEHIPNDVLAQLRKMTDRVSVLEEELTNKLAQNEALNNKVEEIERLHTEELSAQSEKFRKEISMLEDTLRESLHEVSNKALKSRPIEPVKPLCVTEEPVVMTMSPSVELGFSSLNTSTEISDAYEQTLKSALNTLLGFSNFLHLMSQRTEMYPYDSTMEPLPEHIKQLSALFSTGCADVETAVACINTILQRGNVELQNDCKMLHSALATLYNGLKGKLPALLQDMAREEAKVPYSNSTMDLMNVQWANVLTSFFQSLETFTHTLAEPKIDVICEQLRVLHDILSDVHESFRNRWTSESRFPTATRRLQCVSEAIVDCTSKLSSESSRLAARVQSLAIMEQQKPEVTLSPNASFPKVEKSPSLSVECDENLVHDTTDVLSPTSQATYLSPANDLSSEYLIEIKRLNNRIADLELERERYLVDISLLQRKLSKALNQMSDEAISETDHVREFGKMRLKSIMDEKQVLESKVEHYQKECFILLRKSRSLKEQNFELNSSISCLEKDKDCLADELLAVRRGYECQLSSLTEHIADLNAQSVVANEKSAMTPKGLKSFFK